MQTATTYVQNKFSKVQQCCNKHALICRSQSHRLRPAQSTAVYMTEFNYGIKDPPLPDLTNGGAHGIFLASRIIAAINKYGGD